MPHSTSFVRPAQRSDLDTITRIALAAFSAGGAWPYRFPYAKQFPEDHWQFSRHRFAQFLEGAETGAFAVNVVELPSHEDPAKRVVVAYSVWKFPGTFKTNGSVPLPKDNFQRRDAHPARLKAFRESTNRAISECFNPRYGERQLQLVMLATFPEYQRRGAGTQLTRWGIEKAKREGHVVTLFAAPSASQMYKKMSFEVLGSVHTQVDGEEESIELSAMAYAP